MILILVLPVPPRLRSAAASSAAALCVVTLIACGSSGSGGSGTIAATTGVTADIAAHVAGPGLEVEQIVPDGASPHDFELSAQDRQQLEEADVVIANGSGLESGIPLDELDVPVWTLTAHVGDLRRPLQVEGEDEEGSIDPHVWMDPTRVATALPSLADSLADADPDHADEYRARADRYARELRSLDREIADTVASIPPRDRELVTSHDSIGYLAQRYGFDVVATAFPATGPEAEASAARIRDLERAVRDSDVPAVFAAQSDDPEALRLVAEQTGVAVNYDLLVESPSVAGSYEEMLRHDARILARDLGR